MTTLTATQDRIAARVCAEKPEALVLVGPAGAGKTALLHELVYKLTRPDGAASGATSGAGDALAAQRDRPHFAIEATRLIAETGYHRRDKELEELNKLIEA